MDRKLLGLAAAEPFCGLEPDRMGRTVVIAERRDLARIELDLSGWGFQGVGRRICSKFPEKRFAHLGLRKFIDSRLPEFVERWQRMAEVGRPLGCPLIH